MNFVLELRVGDDGPLNVLGARDDRNRSREEDLQENAALQRRQRLRTVHRAYKRASPILDYRYYYSDK